MSADYSCVSFRQGVLSVMFAIVGLGLIDFSPAKLWDRFFLASAATVVRRVIGLMLLLAMDRWCHHALQTYIYSDVYTDEFLAQVSRSLPPQHVTLPLCLYHLRFNLKKESSFSRYKCVHFLYSPPSPFLRLLSTLSILRPFIVSVPAMRQPL